MLKGSSRVIKLSLVHLKISPLLAARTSYVECPVSSPSPPPRHPLGGLEQAETEHGRDQERKPKRKKRELCFLLPVCLSVCLFFLSNSMEGGSCLCTSREASRHRIRPCRRHIRLCRHHTFLVACRRTCRGHRRRRRSDRRRHRHSDRRRRRRRSDRRRRRRRSDRLFHRLFLPCLCPQTLLGQRGRP